MNILIPTVNTCGGGRDVECGGSGFGFLGVGRVWEALVGLPFFTWPPVLCCWVPPVPCLTARTCFVAWHTPVSQVDGSW